MARRGVYRCEATSVAGFIQQLAVCYIRNRYLFYVMGQVREGKDCQAIDTKIIEKYDINISKAERHRRKAAGRANMQYLRLGRTYLILATRGLGRFFEDEGKAIRDAARVPIKFAGYSVGYGNDKVRVRIEEKTLRRLEAYYLDLAASRPASTLAAELRSVPFEPYAPVRYQLFSLLNRINRRRKAAGLSPVPDTAIRKRRRICRPFEPGDGQKYWRGPDSMPPDDTADEETPEEPHVTQAKPEVAPPEAPQTLGGLAFGAGALWPRPGAYPDGPGAGNEPERAEGFLEALARAHLGPRTR